MKIEEACVLVKEIVIGKRWHCKLEASPGGRAVVEIDLNGCGEVLYNELKELCSKRGKMEVFGMHLRVY